MWHLALLIKEIAMKNTHTLRHDEHSANLNWQRVLAFGAEPVKYKTKKQSQQINTPVFVVLP